MSTQRILHILDATCILSHALSDMFCKPGVMALLRCWWLCCYLDWWGTFKAPWGLSHPSHHCCFLIPTPCGSAAAATAMQSLLKHPQSLICFTMANGNTVFHMYTGKAKRLGYLIILPLVSGDPAEPQGNKCFSLPFLICLPSTSTTAKDCTV